MQPIQVHGFPLEASLVSRYEQNMVKLTAYYQQRAKKHWAINGDRNTTYFHQSASARRRKNLIKKLKSSNNTWVEGNGNLKPLIGDYFHGLFTSDLGEVDQGLLNSVKPVVTNDMNNMLLAEYTREEDRNALFQILDLKAPGPD